MVGGSFVQKKYDVHIILLLLSWSELAALKPPSTTRERSPLLVLPTISTASSSLMDTDDFGNELLTTL